jgi:hypothetical protein
LCMGIALHRKPLFKKGIEILKVRSSEEED